uniref:Uncharacterized protein n=2 Tax=Anguilla anguilla TaxID=7936 RepID=A0A0E9QI19_ANGAN
MLSPRLISMNWSSTLSLLYLILCAICRVFIYRNPRLKK